MSIDDYPPPDLSHLQPWAQAMARLPAEERIRHIRADRWIGYPRAVQTLTRLETLYDWPGKQRMPNLLLIGPTNNGKSMIIERFRRQHPPHSAADQEHIPVLCVQMPSEPSIPRFYTAVLAALGAPTGPRRRVADLEQLTLAVLRRVGVRVLVIDELHNVLAGRADVRREFLNLLRFLGNELRIPLVGVGTREAYLAIRSDDQLENRFEPMTLPLWETNADLSPGTIWPATGGRASCLGTLRAPVPGRPVFVATVRDPKLDRPAAAARGGSRRDGTDRSRLTDSPGNRRAPPAPRTKPPDQRRNPAWPTDSHRRRAEEADSGGALEADSGFTGRRHCGSQSRPGRREAALRRRSIRVPK
ncbi:hypothetical protein ABIB51_004397 [Arthrobacter sp. UYCu712]